MGEWLYLLHAPRDDFAVTMSDDEAEARAFMEADPAIASGLCTGELRPFRVSMLRGRD